MPQRTFARWQQLVVLGFVCVPSSRVFAQLRPQIPQPRPAHRFQPIERAVGTAPAPQPRVPELVEIPRAQGLEAAPIADAESPERAARTGASLDAHSPARLSAAPVDPLPEPSIQGRAMPETSAPSAPAATEPRPGARVEPTTNPAAVAPPACVASTPVRFIRRTDAGREAVELPLVDSCGHPDRESLEALTVLARPQGVHAPSESDRAAHLDDVDFLAAEVHRLDPGLLSRLRALADRFPGHEFEIISGYRPDAREGSRHRHGQALDVRIVGVPLREAHAFALGLDESGIGVYPTSDFLHVDVRERATRWVDLSGPDEPSRIIETVSGTSGAAASAPPLAWQWPDVSAPRTSNDP